MRSVFVGSSKCVCMGCGQTLCTLYIKLTFHLHHARPRCSVFTALWCGSVVKLTFYLHHAVPILALASLVWITCVHPPGYGGTYQSAQWYK